MITTLLALIVWFAGHLSPAPAPGQTAQVPDSSPAFASPAPAPAPWMLPPDPVEVDQAQLEPDAEPAADASAADLG